MSDVVSGVWSGTVHMLHGHLDWLSKQLFIATAEDEFILSKASLYSITPTPATFAAGDVTTTGSNGSVIPHDSLLQVDGREYRVVTDATIASGTATVAIAAVLSGSAGDLAAGVTLAFESPIAGVSTTATVDVDGITGGFDQESPEQVGDRLSLRLKQPPEGGADQDWIGWALAVAGVTRAWVYRYESGLGTLTVRFAVDDNGIFPDGAAVTAVQAALDAKRPTTAEVTAAAPTPLSVAFTIHLSPDTTATRAAVSAELADLLFREGEPGDGAGRGTILHSHITTAIGDAEGVTDFTVTVPAGNVVPTLGELPVLGTITWT